tara:strand:+ start:820 stop:1698 length:879 start_codon:yes stop_codon:yes gene_type:complete
MNSYVKKIDLKGEDRHFVHDEPEYMLFGVADGHGGHHAAEICKQNVPEILNFENFNDDTVTEILKKFFTFLHEKCLKSGYSSGSTLTIVILHKDTRKYVCANVGDSHAIHIKPTTYFWITNSHRLQDNANERQRLKDYISYIMEDGVKIGPPRLFPGGLSCSRSIGDSDCQHIICEPSIYFDRMEDNDSIVICTDGIWDKVPLDKLITLTRNTYNPEFLCRLATKKGIFDDCTALIITSEKCKTSMHTGLFHLFTRSSSYSSSDEDLEKSPTNNISSPFSKRIIFKVPSMNL